MTEDELFEDVKYWKGRADALIIALERAREYVRPTHAGDVQADADLRAIDQVLGVVESPKP